MNTRSMTFYMITLGLLATFMTIKGIIESEPLLLVGNIFTVGLAIVLAVKWNKAGKL